MSDALLRVSEAVALTVADLEADGPNTVRVRKSKTDQGGEGAALFVGPSTVAAVRRWLEAAGIEDEDAPIFQRMDKGGTVRGPLSTQSVRKIIKQRAKAAGVEGKVPSHSLRVGSAQSLAAAGAGLVDMQQAGRRSSPAMPGHYARGRCGCPPPLWRLSERARQRERSAGSSQSLSSVMTTSANLQSN